jgi:quercetin dioxygenase-like cupin family protein
LWLVRAALAPGASVSWSGHGDEGVFVLEGAVEVDGRTCPAGGAVIAESGMACEVRSSGGASVVHVGRRSPEPDGGGTVRVVGPGGTYAKVGEGRDTRYFADSEPDRCRMTLFTTGRSHEHVSAPHSHSADELLHVLDGEVVVGRRRLGPGSTIAIHAGRRYGFRSPGFRFLNYRAERATMTVDRAAPPIDEGPRAHDFDRVMDLR